VQLNKFRKGIKGTENRPETCPLGKKKTYTLKKKPTVPQPSWHIFVKENSIMTPEQFDQMISVLKEIRQEIGEIKKTMPAYSAFNLDDIYSKMEQIELALYPEGEEDNSSDLR
jgi:hypothetical protein